jgi:hypothetical protein
MTSSSNTWVLAGAIAWIAVALGASGSARQVPSPSLPADTSGVSSLQRALVDRYCVTCHNDRLHRGELRLSGLNLDAVAGDAPVWEKVVRKLRAGLMPPPGSPRPDKASYDGFASWLESELDRAAAAHPNPGRTEALHRLNRTEYHHAIRDLLGLDVRVADLLPADDQSFGFDNVAGVLSVSPTLLERYMAASWKIARLAVGGSANTTVETFRLRGDFQQDDHIDGLPFGTRGGTVVRYTFPLDAEYAIDVRLQGPRTETHQLEVSLDGEQKALLTLEPGAVVPNVDGELMSETPTLRLTATAGAHEVGIAFVKKSSIEPDGARLPFLRPYNNQLTQPVLTSSRSAGRWTCRPRNPATRRAAAPSSCAGRNMRPTKRRAPTGSSRILRVVRTGGRSRRPSSRHCGRSSNRVETPASKRASKPRCDDCW